MKTKVTAVLLAVSALAGSHAIAAPLIENGTIDDSINGANSYWGAQITGSQADVIGSASVFNVEKAVVTLSETRDLTVVIHTGFVDYVGKGSALTAQYGDLFLNATWDPYVKPDDDTAKNVDHFGYDNLAAESTTEWRYALVMDDHTGVKTSGDITLYALAADNVNVLDSDHFFSSFNGDWRDDQAVRVDASKATATSKTGTWSADKTANTLTYSINLAGTDLLDAIIGNGGSNLLALQWSMTCANDVLAGELPVFSGGENVPTPGVLALMLGGLGGLYWTRRRRA